jgi:AbrB family looped-hinge helix DNA binding protein
MGIVKVTTRYQITIPKDIRRRMGLRPGMTFNVVPCGSIIELAPTEPTRKMRGFLGGADAAIDRDEESK